MEGGRISLSEKVVALSKAAIQEGERYLGHGFVQTCPWAKDKG